MDDVLARCHAFSRRLAERRAQRVVPTRYGPVVLDDELPRVWYLNALLVDPGVRAHADDLVAEVDRVQSDAQLRHRKIAVDEDEYGASLEPHLRSLGWRIEKQLVMTYVAPGRQVDTSSVVEVARDALEPVWVEETRLEPWGSSDETVRQLVTARARTERAVAVQYFAVQVGDEIASYCELYSAGGVGQIENVGTRKQFRNRGLASAVVTRGLEESAKVGNDLTFLIADAEDLPKELYRRLGFAETGLSWDLIREPDR